MVGAARRAVFFSNLGNFLLGVLIAGISALLIYILIYPYFSAWFTGGTTWTEKDFSLNDTSTQDVYFVNVDSDFGGDTGYYEETSYLFIPLGQAHFGALFIGDTIVITKSNDPLPDIESAYHAVGTIKDFESDVLGQVVNKFRLDLPAEYRSSIYPRLLDMTDAEGKIFWILGGLASLAAALVGLYFILRSIIRTINGNSHPIWKNLTRYSAPSKEVLRTIEAEKSIGVKKYGDTTLTSNWLIQHRGAKFQVAKIQDIVWMYPFIQTGRYGSTYYIKIYDRHGVMIQSQVKRKEAGSTLESLQALAPWALIGSNALAEKTWKKDRAEFIRQVDERKKALAAGTAPSPV